MKPFNGDKELESEDKFITILLAGFLTGIAIITILGTVFLFIKHTLK